MTWDPALLSLALSVAPGAVSHMDDAQFARYCTACHGTDVQKGGVRFDTLDELSVGARSGLIERAREALVFEEMPPEGEPRPDADALAAWIAALGADRAATREKLRLPHYGNVVDHEALFSGEEDAAASTPARRWLVSPQIFHERVMDVFKLEGWDRQNKQHRSFVGVTNPFLLPEHSGVRYYDVDALDGGDLLVMLGNAEWIAERQIAMTRKLRGERVETPSQRDRWMPRRVSASYSAFGALLEDGAALDAAQLEAAVQEQFDCVLRRAATAEELVDHVALLRTSIAASGNAAGLRQMLRAVLLESEFVYRLEFGAGEPDEHGRRPLAPREAAEALSYALGDRRADAELLAAADEGRLVTREDYQREARRLLADGEYYAGQIDPSLNGKHYRSNVTSHPRLIRFFREFFGYPGATKVFKDPPRSGGVFQNPGRGTNGTPGRLILETDRIVTRIVDADEDVLTRLLTFDEFFVYHDKTNEKGQEILDEWGSVYERLADTPWRTEPQAVLEEHLEFLQTKPSMRIKDASKPGELVNYMHFFEEYFGRGIQPFTTVPWAHGYTYHHSPLYNLPPTPSIGRYGSWKSTEYRGEKVTPREFWDYPAVQPFRIENRMGLLTHPSWLIAHSTNFHSDPVRRGRWIREKLLAGRVPDVPITVDAQVPDNPHKTFRERFVEVTSAVECRDCHQHMNPLGLPFEAYDDFGRFRTEEDLEHPDNLLQKGNGKTTFDVYPKAPVVTTGSLDGTGDPELDGDVDDPFELIERLARSERVRQSIIRHAFRFFMGRNERLSDSRTLIAADRAYLESGGSFKEVVVSLLSSDSFRLRRDADQ